MSIIRTLLGTAALALSVAGLPSAWAQQPGVLRVSAIPDEAPTELQRKFKPLGEYLEKETGLEVAVHPGDRLRRRGRGLATNKIDLAWLGGFTFVQAKLRTNGGAMPIVQRAEDEMFTSNFIVPTASTAKTLADLKGKTFAFGSPSSTSGSLMPRYFLLQAGIEPERDFKTVAFSRRARRHRRLRRRRARPRPACSTPRCWDKLVESNNPNAAKVRVLATTPPYYDYNWTVRPGLDAGADEEAHRRLPEARPGQARRRRRSWTCSGRRSSSRRNARTTTASRPRRSRPGLLK